jgi:hypothetical protein
MTEHHVIPRTSIPMRTPFALAALSLSLLLGGCDSPSAIDGYPRAIRAEAKAQTLSVTNMTFRPIHYEIFERVDAGVIFWGKCTLANAGCPVLEPGETLRLPYAEIGMYEPGDTEAIVYWWESEPDGADGYKIVREGELVVRL